jgi:hypothetical protein
MRPLLMWGWWDSLILTVTSFCKPGLLSPEETDDAWGRIGVVYENHSELLETRRALNKAFGRLILRAWDTNPPSGTFPEPSFIRTLRSYQKLNFKRQEERHIALDTKPAVMPSFGSSPASDTNLLFGDDISDNLLFDDQSPDFNIDWKFWDQLLQDGQVQADQQENWFLQQGSTIE